MRSISRTGATAGPGQRRLCLLRRAQFDGVAVDGGRGGPGQVDAIGGATITSRAVSAALTDASKLYSELKPQIVEKAKALK